MPRLKSRELYPTAVKSRNLGNIIYGSDVGSAQTTLGNGEQAFIQFTLTQNSEYELSANNYLAIYIGSVATANLLPGGAGIDETQWQVIGPFYDYDEWTDQSYAKHIEIVSLYVLNISAGAQTVLIRNKWRYISPQESATN